MSSTTNFTSTFLDNERIQIYLYANALNYLEQKEIVRNACVSRIFKAAVDICTQNVWNSRKRLLTLVDQMESLTLPSGKAIFKSTFMNDPLFKDTREKNEVFEALINLRLTTLFDREYRDFLSNLNSDNWYLMCKVDCFKTAYLSLMAFLDNEIDKEELFIIHGICEAYRELKIHPSENRVEVVDVDPQVLSADNIATYLKNAGFAPFAENSEEFMITNRKEEEELEKIRNDSIQKFGNRSIVKRTFLQYTLSSFKKYRRKDSSIELSMYFGVKCSSGFIQVTENRGTIVIPPLEFIIELLRSTSMYGKEARINFTFGYVKKYDVMFDERRGTAPSVLFTSPFPHGMNEGPARLSMMVHDIYHAQLDINNPHVQILIKIGKKLLEFDNHKKFFPYMDLSAYRSFAGGIIDREANQYRQLPPERAFWKFLKYYLFALKSTTLVFFRDPDIVIKKFMIDLFFPIVEQELENFNTYQQDSVRPIMPTLEEALKELQEYFF